MQTGSALENLDTGHIEIIGRQRYGSVNVLVFSQRNATV